MKSIRSGVPLDRVLAKPAGRPRRTELAPVATDAISPDALNVSAAANSCGFARCRALAPFHFHEINARQANFGAFDHSASELPVAGMARAGVPNYSAVGFREGIANALT